MAARRDACANRGRAGRDDRGRCRVFLNISMGPLHDRCLAWPIAQCDVL